MKQTWRWFGPRDNVSLRDVRQAGATGVVTALHHLPNGAVWSPEEIQSRHALVNGIDTPTGLTWNVVESLPISEDIKRQTGDWKAHIANYKQSLIHLADSGLEVICYNFMPVLDWTRTELKHELPDGARCMRFDAVHFAAFDLFILSRAGAAQDHTPTMQAQAKAYFDPLSAAEQEKLAQNVTCGLPGAAEGYSLAALRAQLALYDDITADQLRQHHIDFLSEVVPVAEQRGLRLCCHPDDPPFPLLGLPRIMSTEADYKRLVQSVPSPANGITFCTGSLGVRGDNDLPGMITRLGEHIHFVHLRNIKRETQETPNSFHEAAHLEGETDMVAVISALLTEERRRQAQGRADSNIPFRPDHGQDILTDLGANTQPGYPAVGRLKGLAELRGIIHALTARQTA